MARPAASMEGTSPSMAGASGSTDSEAAFSVLPPAPVSRRSTANTREAEEVAAEEEEEEEKEEKDEDQAEEEDDGNAD